MANNDRGVRLEQALAGERLALDAEDAALVDLAHELRQHAPEAPMDPLARDTLRSQLLAAHPNARPQADDASGPLTYSVFPTPVGDLLVAYVGTTVRMTDLGVSAELFERECTARLGERPLLVADPPAALERAVRGVVEKRERFSGNVDLSHVPEFQRKVLMATLGIRPGEIRSYGWLAQAVGSPGAARAVGTAMAHNPIPVLIPCHRVVRSDYHIGEYGCGGPTKKREILTYEGVDVDRLERLARQGMRFLGSDTTKIFCLPGCYTARHLTRQHEKVFKSQADAEAAGYRPCKVCRPA